MLELLNMCGFDEAESQLELPRIKKAFARMGLDQEDIQQGKHRLNTYYDIQLAGLRKIFRLCLLEIVDCILAREEGRKKILFGLMAPGWESIGSAIVTKSADVLAAHQSWAYMVIAGCMFGKMVPILEAAENKWLKAGIVSHCGNVKTFASLLQTGIMPRPDLIISEGFSCEVAPKTIDLLHELYDIPAACCDSCQDRAYSTYSADTERVVLLAAQSLRMLVGKVEEIVDFPISDSMLEDVLQARDKLMAAVGRLHGIIENSDPMPISATYETLVMALMSLTLSLEEGLPQAVDAVDTLCRELQERVRQGKGVTKKGAPRILAMLPPHHADPRLEHLVEEMGMAIVATDPGFSVPHNIKSADVYVNMSLHLTGSLATSLPRRIPLILEVCKRLRIDGVIDRYHVGCRAVAGDAPLLKEAISRELGIPVLLMDWENFDPRVYNHEGYSNILEIFRSMLRA